MKAMLDAIMVAASTHVPWLRLQGLAVGCERVPASSHGGLMRLIDVSFEETGALAVDVDHAHRWHARPHRAGCKKEPSDMCCHSVSTSVALTPILGCDILQPTPM